MKDTLLGQTLRALNPAEYAELGAMLLSPLFNPTRLATKCMALHRFYQTNGFEGTWSPEQVFEVVYPGKPFNRRLLDNVMVALLDAAREYIAWRQQRHRQGEAGLRLEMARFYRERNLSHRFEQSVDHARRELGKQYESLSPDHFYQLFLTEKAVYDHQSCLNNLQSDLNLPAMADAYVQYCLVQGLELALRLEHQAAIAHFSTDRHSAFFEHLRSLAKAAQYYRNPCLELIDSAFDLLSLGADEAALERFLVLLEAEGGRLSFLLHSLLASVARHYCTGLINRGFPRWRPVLLDLYQSHLDKELLYENGRIPQSTLLNIVNIAVGAGHASWAQGFLESHRARIAGSESPEAIYQFIQASLHFNLGDFASASFYLDAAFAEINRLEDRSHFKDLNLKLMARKLEIQVLYEQDPASSLLVDRLNAHKMFLHRNRHLSQSHRNLHNNFVDLMKQLSLPATQANPKRAQKLLDKLSLPGFLIADRKWVTEKVRALVDGPTIAR